MITLKLVWFCTLVQDILVIVNYETKKMRTIPVDFFSGRTALLDAKMCLGRIIPIEVPCLKMTLTRTILVPGTVRHRYLS